jgi:hypothetical protein
MISTVPGDPELLGEVGVIVTVNLLPLSSKPKTVLGEDECSVTPEAANLVLGTNHIPEGSRTVAFL